MSQDFQWQELGREQTIRRTMRMDPETSRLVIHNHQDCDEILKLNQAFLNAERASSTLWGSSSMVRVASVPLVWLEDLLKKGCSIRDRDDQQKILRMLSSNEYAGFRTAPGRLA